MTDSRKDGGTSLLDAALRRLHETGDEQSMTLHMDISGRTQTVVLTMAEDDGVASANVVAYSPIADASKVDDADLLAWSARHAGLQFRRVDGDAVAYVVVAGMDPARQVARLGRIADRLENELAEGG